MMKKVLVLFCCCFAITTTEQINADTLMKRYNTQLIYRLGSKIMAGKESKKITALRNQFTMSPDGLLMYQKAMRQYKTGRLIS